MAEASPILTLTPTVLMWWILDPKFYQALPAGMALSEDDGRAAHAAILEWAMTADPWLPQTPNIGNLLSSFVRDLAAGVQAAVANGVSLEPLRDFIAGQVAGELGYAPRRFRIYDVGISPVVF